MKKITVYRLIDMNHDIVNVVAKDFDDLERWRKENGFLNGYKLYGLMSAFVTDKGDV